MLKIIPMNKFELILSRHQNLFIETSSILYESLNNVAMLKEFHIVLPPSWNRSDCNRNFTSMAPAEADVRIESGHPVYGNRPWTQQTRDCGQLGDYISIGSSFFTEDSALGGRGHLMMRQWARYLFGIFDDTSCLNDTSVPSEFCSSPSRDVDELIQILN